MTKMDVMSINIHRMFEYLFCADESSSFLNLRFENDVKMYGTQTVDGYSEHLRPFENDVKMYGTQTHSGAGEMEGEALKKKIVAAEVILWVTALVAISNINWGGFFWCFSLMIIGYLAFLAVDAEEKRKKTEAEKAEKKKDRVFQMWLKM